MDESHLTEIQLSNTPRFCLVNDHKWHTVRYMKWHFNHNRRQIPVILTNIVSPAGYITSNPTSCVSLHLPLCVWTLPRSKRSLPPFSFAHFAHTWGGPPTVQTDKTLRLPASFSLSSTNGMQNRCSRRSRLSAPKAHQQCDPPPVSSPTFCCCSTCEATKGKEEKKHNSQFPFGVD